MTATPLSTRFRSAVFAACAAAVLGGCELSTGHQSNNPGAHTGDASALMLAMRDGPVPTVVVGRPFGYDRTDFEETVAGHLKGHIDDAPHADFVAVESEVPGDGVHVVVAFDLPYATDPNALCADRGALRPDHHRGAVSVHMAVCMLGKAREATHGAVDEVFSAYDWEFRYFLAESMRHLALQRKYPTSYVCLRVDCS
jgi:hypothetical protein